MKIKVNLDGMELIATKIDEYTTLVPSFKFEGKAKGGLGQLASATCHVAFEFESSSPNTRIYSKP